MTSSLDDEINELVFMMKLSEQAERYKDMVKYAKALVEIKQDLNDEQRNLISVAYKNVIGGCRAACRSLNAIEQKPGIDDDIVEASKDYRSRIDEEVEDISKDIISILDQHLIGGASDDEGRVFFYKMKGDYYRYIGEIKDANAREDIADKSEEAYKKASEFAKSLVGSNPIKLGLALNFSVFYYEIRNSSDEACSLAQQAFDEAIGEMDTLKEEAYQDTTLIMQLLRDNLTLWSSDIEQGTEHNS